MSELGERLGQGATADIHAWGEGAVLKLFRPEYGHWLAPMEAARTRAAHASGAPAPPVLDEVVVGERRGIVLPRYDGPTLFDLLSVQAIAPETAGGVLADLYLRNHACRGGADLPAYADWAVTVLDRLGGNVSTDLRRLIEQRLAGLPSEDTVCHGDLHVQNVLMTTAGPQPIDWLSAVRAPFAYDVARCHLTLGYILPEPHAVIGGRIHRSFLRAYAAGAGLSEASLLQAITPFMPLMAGMRLAEPAAAAFERPILEGLLRG